MINRPNVRGVLQKSIAIYRSLSIILMNTVIIFIALNILANFIPSPAQKNNLEQYYKTPHDLLANNPELMQQIHDGKSIEEIKGIYSQFPNVKSHPVLEFMTIPVQTKYYHIGFENCRYNSFIHDKNIKSIINGSVWVFGGSTAFGVGVAGNETIASFLNLFDSTNKYINFGVPAYNQLTEINKLILLLKKGYRPKSVIFIDGLNDLYSLGQTTLHHTEFSAKNFNSYRLPNDVAKTKTTFSALYSLPIIRLYYEYRAKNYIQNNQPTSEELQGVYHMNDLYTKQPFLHYYISEILSQQTKDISNFLAQILNYYKTNIDLVQALSSHYNFDFQVYFQPFGVFSSKNLFIVDTNNIKQSALIYKNVKPVYEHIKTKIRSGELKRMIDISDAERYCDYPYVDLTHYSKSMNAVIAGLILKHQSLTKDSGQIFSRTNPQPETYN